VDLHTPSSMMTLGIIKFVQGGCQSILQMSTKGYASKCACNTSQQYHEGGEAFLQWIVTDNEM